MSYNPSAGGGVSDGDKGDITVSASGATWTIDNGVVTLAKQANMATASVVYRKTAGAGAPEVQTLATLKTDLGLTGTNTGDQTITLTGDVTGSGTGSFAATLATVNANVGSFGGSSAVPVITVNAKGLITAVSTVTPIADLAYDTMFFGDGSDGDLVASSGTTTLTRDTYYNNVTLTGTAKINTAQFRLYVKGTLDISAAGAGAIFNNGNAGANATNATGGTRGTVLGSSGTLDNPIAATPGANGTTGAGAQATQADATGTPRVGGTAGTGGKGGNVGASLGGAARSSGTVQAPLDSLRRLVIELATWNSSAVMQRISAGQPGSGGSSGAGDGVGTGGGGGGGGSGAGIVMILARTINRSGSTAAGCIQAIGGAGGGGASGGSGGTNRAGGGGGNGAGGGWIVLVYRSLTGSTATGALDATGGAGGAGGNGVGTGTGGDSGGAGGGGRIDVYNLGSGTQTITATTSPAAANAASGSTGGAAKSATTQQVSL